MSLQSTSYTPAKWPDFRIGVLLVALVWTCPLQAADLQPAERDLFERHIRPVLIASCIKCHGGAKRESGLDLTSRRSIVSGGESGPAIVPGDPASSLLLEALRYESLTMPPDGPLDAEQVKSFMEWIQLGAPWPTGIVLQAADHNTSHDTEWWCYQSVEDVRVPQVKNEDWCHNEIDQFVLARLEANEIAPAAEANSRTIVRRLYYSATGLPPDDAALDFNDGQEEYTDLVDHLLDSPAYGEHQARFWLDLVRYADSDGYRADHSRPHAKLYRDYVIDSFNADKSYDQFVMEQLAGDETDPANRDALVATMYLRHWIYEHNQRDVEGQWSEILNDITETTADVFLAQGIKCARCHDHKFDPIAQRDYFRLKAFFAGIQPREDMQIGTIQQRTDWSQQNDTWLAATEKIRRELHEIETPVLLEHSTKEGFDKFVPEIKAMMLSRASDRSPYEHQIASLALRQLEQHPDELPKRLDPATEQRRQALRRELAKFDSLKPDPLPTLAFVCSDVGADAPDTYVPDTTPRTAVAPGILSVFDERPMEIPKLPRVLKTSGRRTALAKWITDAKNPLTARVVVNRVWQQHFGTGLVSTVSDFGHLGQPPSHPALLDWLASRFIEDGWSLKQLHRRILLSATWRQTSERLATAHIDKVDPANRLIWKMNSRRLSGEEIRDSMLLVSSEITAKKRSIYLPVMRNKRDPLLALFDFPDRIRSTGVRHKTTTSTQALLLLNNSWAHDRASAMASSLKDLPPSDFISMAFRRLYFRQPSTAELADTRQFLTAWTGTPQDANTALIHTLLNSNELIYVD